MSRNRSMMVRVADPDEQTRRARSRRVAESLSLCVDADLLLSLIDSGSAPARLVGGLGPAPTAPPEDD